ncbi:HPP family protein [Roseivivax isoporae]|uniref:Prohead protease n=1 Tax=Roseivivax isoporae LMG 25204 TaxID=1449351 RepID=X7F4Q7_9RHOB|nr:HPP family protein [Roseivivax isoporae]ETX27051.1 prohead protease [Roseivivax isoporae LMG 25204]
MRAWHHLCPALPAFHGREQLRAGIGAMLGITLCALAVSVGGAFGLSSLHLVAPLGATAVLVFCVPNSPLAQPWSAIVGNMIAALVALAVIEVVPGAWSVGVAVGAAIAAMMLVRALHPPGGAVALLTALDPAPALDAGPLFALMPVGLTTAVLVLGAVLYNRATGRVYPFRQPETAGAREPAPRLGLSTDQLGALLDRFNQSTNLGVADLGRLLAAAEAEAVHHRFDGTTCADVMTTDLITVRPDTPLPEAARLFRTHAIKSLPVVADGMTLRGLVLQADLLAAAARTPRATWSPRTRQDRVADVMRAPDRAVPHDMPVGALLNRLAAEGSEVIPVTRGDRLDGILTRSDILRLLLRGAEERDAA